MKQLIEKLVAIQSELKAPKGQTNKFGGYKYRSCEDILEAVKPFYLGPLGRRRAQHMPQRLCLQN
jgi:hypothetical protein